MTMLVRNLSKSSLKKWEEILEGVVLIKKVDDLFSISCFFIHINKEFCEKTSFCQKPDPPVKPGALLIPWTDPDAD